jgi:RHS repeat-associated protein
MKRVGLLAIASLFAFGCGGQIAPSLDGTSEAVTLAISPTNTIGRVVSNGNGAARAFHSYDARGRELATQHVLDGASYTYMFTYGFPCSSDACTAITTATNGSTIVSQRFPDNEAVAYTFDAGGGQQSISSTPSGGTTQTIVSRVLRNARGNTIQVDYGDLTSTTRHYNDTTDLRLNQIETYLTATPSTILQLYTYGWDHNGNVSAINDYCNEASTGACSSSAANTTYSWSYTYDTRDQLLSATHVVNGVSTVLGYAYDAIGNMTNKENVAQSHFPSGAGKPQPHALSSIGAVAYAYNPNGDLTGTSGAATNVAISWNADNMPERLTYGSATTLKSFVGESLWRKQQGGVTTYYLPAMRIENGLYRKYYASFAERDISDKSTCTVNSTFGCLKFYHGDNVHSSTLVTNGAGAVVHRQAYKPYGEDLIATAPGPFTPKLQYNFKEKEGDGSGYYDYGARLYNPAIGSFLSPDSVGEGVNRYAYVSNNPLRYTDPTGHQQQEAQPKVFVVEGQVVVEDPNKPCEVHAPARHFWSAYNPPKANGAIIPGTLGLEYVAGGMAGGLVGDLSAAALTSVASRFTAPAIEAVTEVAPKLEPVAEAAAPATRSVARQAFDVAERLNCHSLMCDQRADLLHNNLFKRGISAQRATTVTTRSSEVIGPEGSSWNMHTAVVVQENGQMMVIDPWWFPEGPLPVNDWAMRLGGKLTVHPSYWEIFDDAAGYTHVRPPGN